MRTHVRARARVLYPCPSGDIHGHTAISIGIQMYQYPSNYQRKALATILPAEKPYFWIGHCITVFRLQAGGSRGQRLSLDSSRQGRIFLIATLYIFIGIAMIKHLPDLLLSSDTLFVPTHPTLSKRLGHYLSATAQCLPPLLGSRQQGQWLALVARLCQPPPLHPAAATPTTTPF